jgi:Protein of unknown function (DUF3617)
MPKFDSRRAAFTSEDFMSFKHLMSAAAAVVFLLAPAAALAAHGKIGLWSSTTTMAIPGMPPQSHSATFCMTAEEVNSDIQKPDPRSGCSYQNASVRGHTFTADMTCKGQFTATGHLTSTYDSDSHFTSTVNIVGQGFNMTNNIEGKWLKADCAGASH